MCDKPVVADPEFPRRRRAPRNMVPGGGTTHHLDPLQKNSWTLSWNFQYTRIVVSSLGVGGRLHASPPPNADGPDQHANAKPLVEPTLGNIMAPLYQASESMLRQLCDDAGWTLFSLKTMESLLNGGCKPIIK